MTVLVVDDFEPLCDLIARHLADLGHHVLTAADAKSARRIVEAAPLSQIDLLLTDVDMPGTNGLQLADWFARACPQAKIVLMARDEILPVRQRGDFLQKPFSWENLTSVVAQAFDVSPALAAA
jgi:two-component system phosphate regulon response regulator OmpR